jgi:DNA replicative helicase MCM subunit Mcm2 (Cdc46/Mcm family)
MASLLLGVSGYACIDEIDAAKMNKRTSTAEQ